MAQQWATQASPPPIIHRPRPYAIMDASPWFVVDLLFPSRGGRLEALDHRDQFMPVPGRLTILLDQSTLDHDEQPRADAQVLQVVGDQQHGRAAIARRADHVEERLLGGHVNADGWRNRDQHHWMAGERSPDNDLLLVPSTQLPGPLVEATGNDI